MHSPDRSIVVLVIPALNEAPVIGQTLDSVPPGLFAQVIVADNGSTDGTADIARARGATVASAPRRGYGSACLAALKLVRGDAEAVVFMQADGSEDPREAAGLIEPLLVGRADLVIGSRTLGKSEPGALTAPQRFGNRLATTLIRWIWRVHYTDLGPFRAIRWDALQALGMQDPDFGWTVEMQVRAIKRRLRVVEIPVTYRKRLQGENKISGDLLNSLRAGKKILWTVIASAIRS